ncbi:zinc finger MYM-type protein 3 isoform X2 [Daktulosphaira vitifoliae]|uniref:zinc finger MYM-type protein 3 isoform X2 n=1 Tax=Daktulosphaira vitifoliae TaxID=58002 RepID=UPI0021A9E611|nr:zinc finger MYM-type protein 3 isoform X2 [Daktulosphaira vitifoliae]
MSENENIYIMTTNSLTPCIEISDVNYNDNHSIPKETNSNNCLIKSPATRNEICNENVGNSTKDFKIEFTKEVENPINGNNVTQLVIDDQNQLISSITKQKNFDENNHVSLLNLEDKKTQKNFEENISDVLNEKSSVNEKDEKFNLINNKPIKNNQKNELDNMEVLSADITSEFLTKTTTRPQRQAAKKAESQIREIAKEIIKPLDRVEEKVIEIIEGLSSPLKKVCCQCNRFRLCNFTIKSLKSMYLCQEECVTNYQNRINQLPLVKKCEQCQNDIVESSYNYFNWQTKNFCSVICLNQYQTLIFENNCGNCHEVISSDTDFGKHCRNISGKILQFCGVICLENYEEKLKLCSFCQKKLLGIESKDFCSSFCQTKDYESRKKKCFFNNSYVGKNDSNFIADRCNICSYILDSSNTMQIIDDSNFVIQYCSKECLNKCIATKKKVVSCNLCKHKKFNFDMISARNPHSNDIVIYLCSLYCLHQLPELSHKKISNQNYLQQLQINKKQMQKVKSKSSTDKCISSARGSTRKYNRKEESHKTNSKFSKGKRKTCKKIIYDEITDADKLMVHKEIQTDLTGNKGVIIPIPVPVYIPMPMHMFTTPYPVPVPFPIPLPIPIFIPTPKNTLKRISKDIKKIQEEIPSDPFEAELLLMAGMVAEEKDNHQLLSESENDSAAEYNNDSKEVESSLSPKNHNSFGDDVLAMAFNMASADTESLNGTDDVSNINTNSKRETTLVDDVEANLVSSTIISQTSNSINSLTPDNLISPPDDVLRRPPRKRTPRTTSQKNTSVKRSRKNNFPSNSSIPSSNTTLLQQENQNSHYSTQVLAIKPDAHMCLKYTLGVNAWRQWANIKSVEFEKTLSSNTSSMKKTNIFKLDLLQLTASELNYSLCLFLKELRKPNGSDYAPDTIYYLCLGIQQYLFENGRIDNIFTDIAYEKFTDALNEIATKFSEIYNDAKYIVTRVEEEYLWESKQLGAHSPYVLLCTLIFFNAKHFNLTSVEEHMQLSFSHIMKHWKRNPNLPTLSNSKQPSTYRNVLLRFYPPQATIDLPNSRKKKVYEQHENEDNPLRCPVKLYEFYLSKCPESVKTRNDLFYLTPERSCVPDSPVWYAAVPLDKNSLEKMLNRVKMVKEINISLLSS